VKVITRHIDHDSRSDIFRIYAFGDLHLGNANANDMALRILVKQIAADDHALWVGMGDYCDFINIHDPRWDPRDLPGWLMGGEQLADIARTEGDYIAAILKPIKDKCLGLIAGNHEEKILQHSENDVYAKLVERLADGKNEHRLDHRGIISLIFSRQGGGSQTVTLYCTHGSAGGRTQGGAAASLDRLLAQVDNVDVVLTAHLHKGQHLQMAKFRPGRAHTRAVTIHGITIPPMVSDMRYAESKDYAATSEGYAVITVDHNKRKVSATLETV
jgi:hypothetical protein